MFTKPLNLQFKSMYKIWKFESFRATINIACESTTGRSGVEAVVEAN